VGFVTKPPRLRTKQARAPKGHDTLLHVEYVGLFFIAPDQGPRLLQGPGTKQAVEVQRSTPAGIPHNRRQASPGTVPIFIEDEVIDRAVYRQSPDPFQPMAGRYPPMLTPYPLINTEEGLSGNP